MTGLDALLVDDTAGSGATLAHTADVIRARDPARLLKDAHTEPYDGGELDWPSGRPSPPPRPTLSSPWRA
ncbi:hypothetical protein [Streptomyces tubercidicus]